MTIEQIAKEEGLKKCSVCEELLCECNNTGNVAVIVDALLRKVNGSWIPVSERLPEMDEIATGCQHYQRSATVLVWDVELAEYNRFHCHPESEAIQKGFLLMGILNEWRIEGRNNSAKVTHWRHLPEPPKL